MRWSHALSAAAVLLVATLALKAAALGRPEPDEDHRAYLATLATRLRAAGFTATIDRRKFVTARRGNCTMKVRDLNPVGTARLAYERLGAAYGPTRYAWRGRYRADPPWPWPLLQYYAQRELARIGIRVPRPSVTAVAAAPACAVPAALFDQSLAMR